MVTLSWLTVMFVEPAAMDHCFGTCVIILLHNRPGAGPEGTAVVSRNTRLHVLIQAMLNMVLTYRMYAKKTFPHKNTSSLHPSAWTADPENRNRNLNLVYRQVCLHIQGVLSGVAVQKTTNERDWTKWHSRLSARRSTHRLDILCHGVFCWYSLFFLF